jgi:hypothetical protein
VSGGKSQNTAWVESVDYNRRGGVMRRNYKFMVLLFFMVAMLGILLCYGQTSKALPTISATEAEYHIGEVVTVCDIVASTRYASSMRGQPTFLNLSKPYPNRILTAVIWGRDRDKFGEPEEKFRDKHICVTGKIRRHHRGPEIVVTDPAQITIKEK